ncbi:MAG: hypothetical protein U5K71_08605 [Gracilimonas sp.]|nr:hypothetical protein [Gracilimonas sp.]
MDDSAILFAGIFTTILFLIGYGITIKEYRGLEDERNSESYRDESTTKITNRSK